MRSRESTGRQINRHKHNSTLLVNVSEEYKLSTPKYAILYKLYFMHISDTIQFVRQGNI